jgi:predicted lipoprotein with Yx(FWY)xxD motif
MTDPARQQTELEHRRGRPSILKLAVAATTLAFAASLAAIALAAPSMTVGSAFDSKLDEQVVVNSQGRTLYALSPETASHLLCKSAECLKLWPPFTVSSSSTKLKDGSGVHGRLGILHRGNGTLQVTLGGLPLYRFSEDHASGQANGQGLKSFGGTWHVIEASKSAGSTAPSVPSTPPTTPSTTPTSTTPGYGY